MFSLNALMAVAAILLAPCIVDGTNIPESTEPFEVKVVVVKYFPLQGDKIDITVTGDVNGTLDAMRKHTDKITEEVIYAMEEGSRYRGYKDKAAKPSLDFNVVKTYEFLERLPTVKTDKPEAPWTDYNAIMERIDGKDWVEKQNVKEVWIYGYHGGKVNLWESNMAGPYGDISNSSCSLDDLPKYSKTVTVYHYNYQRGRGEALEDHMHQMEAVLNHVDGRDKTPPNEWSKLLYWGKYVGSDRSHRMVATSEGFYRCGWSHVPPAGDSDYDWGNKKVVKSDIEDWRPDGSGEKKDITSEIWKGDSYLWFIYWMQSMPGKDSGLKFEGKKLRNWWIFIGDFDSAMKKKMTLVEE